MKKTLILLFVAFTFSSLFADMVNGVKIYQNGRFPVGKTLTLSKIDELPYGKMDKRYFVEIPLEFKNDGIPNGKGGYTYNAKVNRTWLGGFVSGFTDPDISTALFRVTFPYKTPFYSGDAYSFTFSSPITIISKDHQIGSNAKKFDIYNCIYEGYLDVNGVTYPSHIPEKLPGNRK